MENFKEFRIETVFEHHLYDIFKFSLDQIRNGFKIPNIGIENRQTRNQNLNTWNFAEKNDFFCYRAIILTNALRNWEYCLLIKTYVKWMKSNIKSSTTKLQMYTFLEMMNS